MSRITTWSGSVAITLTDEQVAAFDSYLAAALEAISGVRHDCYISPLARKRLGEAHEALLKLSDSWCEMTYKGGK